MISSRFTARQKPSSAPQPCALTSTAVAQSPVIPSAEEHHRKRFPGSGLGMALLHPTNDVHMWLLFILCSLMLPVPPRPGQVCSWVHLMSPGQLFVPVSAAPEGLGGSKVARGTFRVSLAHPAVSPQHSSLPSKASSGAQSQPRLLQEV